MASAPQFRPFFLATAMLRATQLPSPHPVVIKHLPVSSVFHYLGDGGSNNIDPSNLLYDGYSKSVVFTSVEQLAEDTRGFSSKLMSRVKVDSTSFAMKNRKFKYMHKYVPSALDAQQLLVVNYGYLDSLYRYPQVPEADLLKHQNKLTTFVDQVTSMNSEKDGLNHFLEIPIPPLLLSKMILDTKSLLSLKSIGKIFRTMDDVFTREMWLWLNPTTRDNSVFSKLSDKSLKTVNLLFKTFDGKYTMINMAYLLSWVKGSDNLTMAGSVASFPHTEVQKFWLRSMMTLQSINATGASIAEEERIQAEQAKALEEAEKGADASGQETPGTFQASDNDQSASGPGLGADRVKLRDDGRSSKELDELAIESETDLDKLAKDVDADIAALDLINKKRFESKFNVKADDDSEIPITEVQVDTYTSEIPDSIDSIRDLIHKAKSVEETCMEKLGDAADDGRISGADYRKLSQMVQESGNKPDPYGSGKKIKDAAKITEVDLSVTREEAKLNVPKTVIDPSMGYSTLNVMESKYNTKTIYKDTLRVVQAVQRAGIIVRNHEVETMHTALGSYDIHTLELKPIKGQPSIIRARIPKVDDEGVFVVKGNRSLMRRQQVDRPLRRIGPNRVGMSSYYGKTFVDRADKKANSYLEYVFRRLTKATISPDEHLRDVSPGEVFDNYFTAPYIYSGLSSRFISFRAGPYLFNLNHLDRLKAAPPELLAKLEVNGRRLIGQGPGKQPIVVDKSNQFFLIGADGEKAIGDIFDILQLDRVNAPVDFAEVKVFSKPVPVGVFIAYNIGFRKLVKYLGAKHRLVEGRQQKRLGPYEYHVQFLDVAYVFDRRDAAASLVLAGFTAFEKETKQYNAEEFDTDVVYKRLLESRGLSSLYLNEMENLNDLFIDPITMDLLAELNEPQTFMGLLIRACEMLDTFHHPAGQDTDFQRSRGYERFAGLLYTELATSIKAFKNKNGTGRAKVDMSPFAVWSTLTRDNSVKHAEDINPIQAIKGMESLTTVGAGGRSKESMNRDSRAMHKNGLGVISVDASVDSSDVGINIFTSADPGYNSVRGMSRKGRPMGGANLFGTSALLAPFSNHDDAKRVAFVSIQQAHTVATQGYHAPVVRTGYESVLGQRTGEMFASAARQDGKVISLTDSGILVEYADGSRKGFQLGTMYGKAEGTIYPHPIISPMKAGQKFKKGDYISYNTNFFEPDPILPGGIVYKGSMLTRVAMMELPHTHEDSSTISEELSVGMTTTVSKPKVFVVSFKENVHNIVKVGQSVNPEDVLMTFEDEITAMDNNMSSESMEILANRAKNSPRAGYKGKITKIEVFYHGDKADMSSTLKALADKSDRDTAAKAKSLEKPVTTNFVDSDYSHEGTPLALNKAVIKVQIDVTQGAGTGDKLVFGNQLKSVIGEVMPYKLTTESGLPIHAKFGAKSFAARIVESLIIMGTLGAALEVVTDAALKEYFG